MRKSVLLCLLGFSTAVHAAGVDWAQLKSLSDTGKLDDALQLLASHPSDDPAYFYNLGTLSFKLNHMGQAVAYLEKAARLQPHDPGIQNNLLAAQTSLTQQLGADKLDPASTWTEAMADHLTMDEARGALGLSGLILMLVWLRSYLKSRKLSLSVMTPASYVALLFFAASISLYTIERVALSRAPAICLTSMQVRSGPGDHYVELGTVEPGVKLRLLGPEEKDWLQVRYSTEGIGWVRASSLLLL